MEPKKINTKAERFKNLMLSGVIEIGYGIFSFFPYSYNFRAPEGIKMSPECLAMII